jgi:hypothetical protein
VAWGTIGWGVIAWVAIGWEAIGWEAIGWEATEGPIWEVLLSFSFCHIGLRTYHCFRCKT